MRLLVLLTSVPRTSLLVNRDKGPFRAVVSGLRRVAESEPWQKGSDGGVSDSSLRPSCLHKARVLPVASERRLGQKEEHLGWEQACRFLFPFKTCITWGK